MVKRWIDKDHQVFRGVLKLWRSTAFKMSHFQRLAPTPPDPAFSLIATFAADNFPSKVDLCPGFYRDEYAKPWILPSVAQVSLPIH